MTNSTLAGPFIDQWRWQSSFPPRPSPEMFHQQPALISRKRRAYSAEGVAACKQSKSSWQADQSPSLYGWNWTFTADAYARAIPPGLRCLTFFLILRKGETEPHCYHGLLTATLIGRGESRVALFHKSVKMTSLSGVWRIFIPPSLLPVLHQISHLQTASLCFSFLWRGIHPAVFVYSFHQATLAVNNLHSFNPMETQNLN